MVAVMKYVLGLIIALACVAPAPAQYYGGHWHGGFHGYNQFSFQTVLVPAPVQFVQLPTLTYAVPQVTYAQPPVQLATAPAYAAPAAAVPVVPDVPPIPAVTAAPVAVVPAVQEVVVFNGHYFHWNGTNFNPLTAAQITALHTARATLRGAIAAANGNVTAIDAARAAFRASLVAAGIPLRRR